MQVHSICDFKVFCRYLKDFKWIAHHILYSVGKPLPKDLQPYPQFLFYKTINESLIIRFLKVNFNV